MRKFFCFGLSLLVAGLSLGTAAQADDSRFLVVLVCLQKHPSTRCNDNQTGVWRFVGNSGGSWHGGHAFWPSGMGGDLVADRLTGKSIVVEMDNVTLPPSLQGSASSIHLVFRGSCVSSQAYSGQYTENDDGKVSHSTWYAFVPSDKDQVAYSAAIDQGLLNAARFNADLKRKAMNNMICITSRLNDPTLTCPSF